MINENSLMTKKEVCKMMGISLSTFCRIQNEIECVLIGERNIRFTKEAINKYIQQKTRAKKVLKVIEE